MSIPGYIAEASLRSARGPQQVAAPQDLAAPRRDAVVPQIRVGAPGGLGGGGLNAWGCWSSWCCGCSYHLDRYGNWNCCDYPCTRCIWPW